MFLIDANVISETMRPRPEPKVIAWLDAQMPSQVFVSAITQGELLLGVALLPPGKRRDALNAQAADMFDKDFARRCLPFDARAAAHYARLLAHRTQAGQPMGTEDAQIAAIACAYQFALVTRNVRDFVNIEGLDLVNPWD